MELRDVVSGSKPVKIPSNVTVNDALVCMVQNKTDYLLVDRAAPNDAYGLITRWDIVARAVAEGKDLATMPILELARKPLAVMNNLDLDIRWVARKMANEGVSKIAVFDKDVFLGFISDVDILRAAAAKADTSKEAEK